MKVTVNTQPFADFVAKCEAGFSAPSGGELQDALLAASGTYHGSMRIRFKAASTNDGTWEPLAPSTVAAHKAIGDDPAHTLILTGSLEESLVRGSSSHVLDVEGTRVIEGTEDPKAAYQHNGTGRIPARPILVFPSSDTLDAMKTRLMVGIRRVVKSGSTLNASDSELEDIFGIELDQG